MPDIRSETLEPMASALREQTERAMKAEAERDVLLQAAEEARDFLGGVRMARDEMSSTARLMLLWDACTNAEEHFARLDTAIQQAKKEGA